MKFVASGAMDGIINVFDIATGKLVHTLEGMFSSAERRIDRDHELATFLFKGHALPVRSLCFSQNSQLLLTASDDGQIKIYDV